jgi:soluble lytic murein transglycosylase-like protein
VVDRFNPSENIAGGVAYLAFLLDLFKGNQQLAVAAYNAGEGAVQKYAGIPPYNETQQYVTRVLDLHQRYLATASQATQ